MKRIVGIITIVVFFVQSVAYTALAEGVENGDEEYSKVYKSNANNLQYTDNNNSILVEELKKDIAYNTGKIDEDNERYLNSIGIFDEEIEDFSDDLKTTLEEECNLYVGVIYGSVGEDGEIVECTSDEVDEFFYEEKENGVLGIDRIVAKASSQKEDVVRLNKIV